MRRFITAASATVVTAAVFVASTATASAGVIWPW